MSETLKKMYYEEMQLPSLLGLEDSRILTLVGAGGKTSLLCALGRAFAAGQQKRTLLTTTTHILRPENVPGCALVEQENAELLSDIFSEHALAALGIPCAVTAQGTKWEAPSMDFLRQIREIPDRILCEGDGSRRLPVKIPRPGEPVFYPGTDAVLGVIGLSCLHRTPAEVLFGADSQASVLSLPERIDPDFLLALALSPEGLFKSVQKEHFQVIFNQADTLTPTDVRKMVQVAQKIRDNGMACHIVSLREQYLLAETPDLL